MKISRNEFMDRLQSGESVFIGVVSKFLNADYAVECISKCMSDKTDADCEGMERRKVVKRQGNGVQFSNGSWLKFDQKCSYACYDLGNGCVMQWFESGGHEDDVHCHQALVYKLVS